MLEWGGSSPQNRSLGSSLQEVRAPSRCSCLVGTVSPHAACPGGSESWGAVAGDGAWKERIRVKCSLERGSLSQWAGVAGRELGSPFCLRGC